MDTFLQAVSWLGSNPTAIGWLGSIVVATAAVYAWVLTRNAALYASFDTLYQDVLERGLHDPWLRDPASTATYPDRQSFSGDKLVKYDTYAYMVFNVCETIADGLDFYEMRRGRWFRLRGLEWLVRSAFPIIADPGWLRKTWEPVLAAEKNLHRKWLEAQKPGMRFKKEFLDLMKKIG